MAKLTPREREEILTDGMEELTIQQKVTLEAMRAEPRQIIEHDDKRLRSVLGCDLSIGSIYYRETENGFRKVQLESGKYWGSYNRVSNWWTWGYVLEGKLAFTHESGYGIGFYEEIEQDA